MPFEIIWEKYGSLWVYSGYVTSDELIASNETFLNDERSDHARYQIIDMLNITGVEADESSMKMLAASDFGAGYYLRSMRVALAAKLPTMRALMEQYQDILTTLDCHWETKMFDDIALARDWAVANVSSPYWELPGA